MNIIKYTDADYPSAVEQLVNRSNLDLFTQDATVRDILQAVKEEGDEALLRYTHRFDGHELSLSQLRVNPDEIRAAYKSVKPKELNALKKARENIRKFHKRQVQNSWEYEEDEVKLGQMIRPLEIVGIYVPGGKASYPSSVLMNAIPAQVAGVEKIIMCCPTPKGESSAPVLVAMNDPPW